MTLRAGAFELDAEAFELRLDGQRVAVEPLVLQLILHLAGNLHRLVSRDELVQTIWQGRAVSDWAVSAAIKAARRALGDIEEPRRYIRTVHGRGLRFVAEVRHADPIRPDPRALAVIPFRTIGGGEGEDYFADGVSEDLMVELSRVAGLRVATRFSAFRFRGTDLAPQEIGRALGADQLLTGAIRREDGALRITAELLDARDGSQLWSDRFTGTAGDIFAMQDAIAERITAALKLHFAAPARARATQDPQAYDLCLRGRWEYFQYSPAHFARAAQYFAEALDRDPDYAEALAYLSYCRTSTHVFAWPGSDDTLDPALDCARRAVALDPQSAVAHARLGWVLGFPGRADEAVGAFDRAVALDPVNPETLHNYGETLNRLCRPAAAGPLLERAFAIDRYVPPSWAMALAHSANLEGRFDAAAERLGDVLARVPGFVPPRVQLVRALAGLGDRAGAERQAAGIGRIAPRYRIATARRMFPYPDPDQAAALDAALRQAGLPE